MIKEDFERVAVMDTLFLLETEQEIKESLREEMSIFNDPKIEIYGRIEERTISEHTSPTIHEGSRNVNGLEYNLPF